MRRDWLSHGGRLGRLQNDGPFQRLTSAAAVPTRSSNADITRRSVVRLTSLPTRTRLRLSIK
jgi:hypothetical protein